MIGMESKHIFIIILSLLSSAISLQDAMYQKTTNMTLSTWSNFKTKTMVSDGWHLCASQCLYHRSTCNSWHFDKSQQLCQLGKVLNENHNFGLQLEVIVGGKFRGNYQHISCRDIGRHGSDK